MRNESKSEDVEKIFRKNYFYLSPTRNQFVFVKVIVTYLCQKDYVYIHNKTSHQKKKKKKSQICPAK